MKRTRQLIETAAKEALERLNRLPPGIRLLQQLHWAVKESNLNEATIGDHKLTPDEIRILQTPIQLTQPHLTLLLPLANGDPARPVTFNTGNQVTPFQILGAIHTYYTDPYMPGDMAILRQHPNLRQLGQPALRCQGFPANLVYDGLNANPDGTFTPWIDVPTVQAIRIPNRPGFFRTVPDNFVIQQIDDQIITDGIYENGVIRPVTEAERRRALDLGFQIRY